VLKDGFIRDTPFPQRRVCRTELPGSQYPETIAKIAAILPESSQNRVRATKYPTVPLEPMGNSLTTSRGKVTPRAPQVPILRGALSLRRAASTDSAVILPVLGFSEGIFSMARVKRAESASTVI